MPDDAVLVVVAFESMVQAVANTLMKMDLYQRPRTSSKEGTTNVST